MGIYYAAVDRNEKTYFESPKDFSIKSPGIYHWNNPFPQMLVMMNSRGYHYKIHNDMEAFYEEYCTYKDITDQVYQMLLDEWPEAKGFYEKENNLVYTHTEFGCSTPISFMTSEGRKTMQPGKRYDDNLNEIEE